MRRPVAGSLLATLSGPVAAQLAKLGTRRPFAASEVLLREGELSTHVYLLLAGLVKVTATTPEGGFALLAIRVAGGSSPSFRRSEGSAHDHVEAKTYLCW